MSTLSQLLLTQFGPNFKVSFLGASLTGVNCHSDFCPGNICFGDICPYQHWGSNIIWTTFCWTQTLGIQNYLDPKLSWAQNSSWIQYFLDQKLFWIQNLILAQILFDPKFLEPKFSLTQNFSGPKLFEHTIFGHKISLHPNFFQDFSWFNQNIPNKTIQFAWGLTQLKLI